MTFTYQKQTDVVVKPSEIYLSERTVQDTLRQSGLKIVAFRPPQGGELFLTKPSCTPERCGNFETLFINGNLPRFIVEKVTDTAGWWE